ncbi:hypothetical protein ACHAWF_004573 [Thalassiosira exigua]
MIWNGKRKGGPYMSKFTWPYTGVPQAGTLANKFLQKRLVPAGYYEVKHTPSLWCHEMRPFVFLLVVDDFGVKYVNKEHEDHFIAAVEKFYPISEDWEGKLYCSIELSWKYDQR